MPPSSPSAEWVDAHNPLPPGPSYPKRVSVEGTHHGQKQGLLQEGEECADQRLQSCEAAKLGGRVPAGEIENLSPQVPLSGFTNAPWPQPGPRYIGVPRLHLATREEAGDSLREWQGACLQITFC